MLPVVRTAILRPIEGTVEHHSRMDELTGACPSGVTPSDHEARTGSEVAEGERRHLLVFDGAASWLHPLPASGDLLIGRAEGVELRIDHGAVSRKHARIV